ncbi:MAG: HAMP domain-containing histidine kinase [Thermoproteota archaeon]|nr:HAMP domain-containing histidine kinase [Thermoproteota archaeon]
MSGKDSRTESTAAPIPPENYDAKEIADPSSQHEEKTEVIYGEENVRNWALQQLSTVNKTLDLCGDRYGPSIIVANEQIMQKYIELHTKGVRQRSITEIVPENIADCKKLMKFQELRHLNGLKGYLAIADGRMLSSHAFGQEGKVLPHVVGSTVGIFVEQQRYFFESLWSKAIPAKQRIKEIEEGRQEEFFEVIDSPERAAEVYVNLAKAVRGSALLLLPTSNALVLEYKLGILEYLIRAAKNNDVHDIRIICSIDDNNIQIVKRLHEEAPNIKIINTTTNLATKLFIVNDDTILRAELRDPQTDTFSNAFGVAIYSNSKPTVDAFKSLFELVWQSQETNEKLQQADRVQKEFISIAAHELRTPIVPILNLSELLYSNIKELQQKGKPVQEEEQQQTLQMLEIILRNANRLHQLTEDILDVTRIESHTLKLRKERFNLNDAILNVVEDHRKQVVNSNVKVIYETANSGSDNIEVEADRRRLMQVISNLLDNAIKFTIGGGTVSVITTTTTRTIKRRKGAGKAGEVQKGQKREEGQERGEGEGEVVIAVKDTGTGIDPELMPRLFTKFATKSYQGTGLGLFISKSIVEAHGGRMWAENNTVDNDYHDNDSFDTKQHSGATFYITLPVVKIIKERAKQW